MDTPPESGGKRKRCGAKNRAGNACQKWPIEGSTRCANHGGRSTGPRELRGNQNGVEHGLYGKVLKGDDLAYYQQALKQLLGDAQGALLHDAAVMRAASARALSRVESLDSMCIVEEKTVQGVDAEGNAVDRTETKRVGIMTPMADVLSRAASIAVKAHDIDPTMRRLQMEKLEAETAKLKRENDPNAAPPTIILIAKPFPDDDDPSGGA